MGSHFLRLAWPGHAASPLERRRAAAIVRRVRGFALLFAVLTTAWIAIDAAVFPSAVWVRIGILRIVASLALVALAQGSRTPAPSRAGARLRLALLYAIPALFFGATLGIVDDAPRDAASQGLAAAYRFVPFVLIAGVAAFPLAAAECAAVIAFSMVVQAGAMTWGGLPLPTLAAAEALWLQALIALVASFSSVSQLELMDALVRQAVRDPLTGLLRRESGQELLQLQFRIALRQASPLTVLFADIDRFKAVNDRFGHEAGDGVLAAACASLLKVCRTSDFAVRWGGEEFVLALPGTTSDEAVTLLDRLRRDGMGRRPDGAPITLSIGIAEWREDGIADPLALVELADQRMYAAKQAGRNRYVGRDGGAYPLL